MQSCDTFPDTWNKVTSKTLAQAVNYGDEIYDLSCEPVEYPYEGAESVTCIGDNVFTFPADESHPNCKGDTDKNRKGTEVNGYIMA